MVTLAVKVSQTMIMSLEKLLKVGLFDFKLVPAHQTPNLGSRSHS